MDVVIKISQFLLSLFDIKYSLFKKKIGETVYGIGWLPLGGYVKIAGMIDESMDKEQMAKPPEPWEFRSKPTWQRLIIMLGGVTVNFVLAWLIYVFMAFGYGTEDIKADSLMGGYHISSPLLNNLGFKTGDKVLKINEEPIILDSDIARNLIGAKSITIEREGAELKVDLPQDFLGQLTSSREKFLFNLRIPFMVAKVHDSSENVGVDLKLGDIIKSIDGTELKYFDEFEPFLLNKKQETLKAVIIRDDELLSRDLTVDTDGKLGIFPAKDTQTFEKMGYYEVTRKEYDFGQSFSYGSKKFVDEIVGYGAQLKAIFTPSTGAYKGLGGFYAIFNIFPDIWSWEIFWKITAFLSIMLGVLNLLPIPALDGGHVMFLLYEMITQRKPSEEFLEKAQIVGFFILIALVLFANGNDVYKGIQEWLSSK